MGKQHGALSRAGKVRAQTPKVAKQENKKKCKTGRAKKRMIFQKRYKKVQAPGAARGPKRGPNSSQQKR